MQVLNSRRSALPDLLYLGLMILVVGLQGAVGAAPDQDHRLDWWREARFGMFIHWGPVSLRGTEIGWSRGDQVSIEDYDQLYTQFNPSKFNANEWVNLAKAAGVKYVVLTTKHHDGFCLWDSAYSDYNVMHSPLHRDVVKELATACKRQGLVFCAYHSICDWHHPDYPQGSPGGKTAKPGANMDHYRQYLKNELAELVHNYGPLGILWFDGEWEAPWTAAYGEDLYRYVRSLQPSVIVNNRVGKGREGMAGTTNQPEQNPGDYDTPEQQIGAFNNQRPWESCMTICQQWAWKPNDKMKSLKECIQTLVQCAGGDGNLLLNVGPMPNGEIEARQATELQEMGAWMKRYGKTIYRTRGGPFKPGGWGASTYRDKTVYLHVFQWPAHGLTLPAIPARVLSARVLTGGSVKVQQTGEAIRISIPSEGKQDIDTVIRLGLDHTADGFAPVSVGPQ